MTRPVPPVDPRDGVALLATLARRRVGYLPGWNPPPKTAGAALDQIAARYVDAVVQRLNRAPARAQLAFLDLLGLRVVPAQSARAPMVFRLGRDAAGTTAPAGTQIAAPPPPGGRQQIVFSTEDEAGITAGTLRQVVSLWPGRDEYLDHSAAQLAGEPFVLFDHRTRRPTDHVLYLGHATLLALAGTSRLEVAFDLAQGSSVSLDLAWEYWDGRVWRGFLSHRASCLDPVEAGGDGTNGLTMSGTVRLVADAARTAPTAVNGVTSYWIRGRLTQPLPPDPGVLLPRVETVRLRTLIDQSLALNVRVAFAAQAAGTRVVANDDAGRPLPALRVTLAGGDPVTTGADGTASASWQFTAGQTYRFDFELLGVSGTTYAPYTGNDAAADVVVTVKVDGLQPDKALLEGQTLDVSKAFFPFGQTPLVGSAFYFKQAEVFGKPGASVQLSIDPAIAAASGTNIPHTLNWEYWNGDEWTLLFQSTSAPAQDFTVREVIAFEVPRDMVATTVHGELGLWMRVRLVSGGYGVTRTITPPNGDPITYVEPHPPAVATFRFGYAWVQGPVPLEGVVACNDFQYVDYSAEAVWPGNPFAPLAPVGDTTATVYLGFDQALPVARFGIYADLEEAAAAEPGRALVWEYWDGAGWRAVTVDDETSHLATAGMLSFVPAADSRALARFGAPLHWLRGRLKEDGVPDEPRVRQLYPNAVWASQWQTFVNVPLGASTGQPSQVFQFSQIPVLAGEVIEVEESRGRRAESEWRSIVLAVAGGDADFVRELEAALAAEGPETEILASAVRLTRDKRKRVVAIAVRWTGRDDFFDSEPGDRHYVLDRASGRLYFGDGDAGAVPPPGAAITASTFRSGGGRLGNVAAGTITQLLGAIPGIQGVANARAAEGGADGETLDAFARRAPLSIRSRGCAIDARDYETLAREASAGVGFARAVPMRDLAGSMRPGWVTVIVIPNSQEPRPLPSAGLRDQVRQYLARHAPCEVAAVGGIQVSAPSYLAIDVSARIAPREPRQAGSVEQTALAALARFLHPLLGGPGGKGWDLGRGVFVSDVAAVLGAVAGVDYVEDLALSVDGRLQGDHVDVPADRIVVAGVLTIGIVERGRS